MYFSRTALISQHLYLYLCVLGGIHCKSHKYYNYIFIINYCFTVILDHLNTDSRSCFCPNEWSHSLAKLVLTVHRCFIIVLVSHFHKQPVCVSPCYCQTWFLLATFFFKLVIHFPLLYDVMSCVSEIRAAWSACVWVHSRERSTEEVCDGWIAGSE